MTIRSPDLASSLLALAAAQQPELAVELAASDVPLALLPVRLETRFFASSSGDGCELRIRVYPDKVHIDAHDPVLSDPERVAGEAFWELFWRAGDDDARRRTAWQSLAEAFEAPRAAWIARATQPLNPDDRPRQTIAGDAPLPVAPRFPAADAEHPTLVPRARLLPDRWIATAFANGSVLSVVAGRDIVEPLAVGPDLQQPVASAALPAIDEGMRWMIDFDSAEASGMALRMPLAQTLDLASIDLVVVTGVKSSLDSVETPQHLAALLDAHHYTDGLAFVAPGTPSNNTRNERAGFSSSDPRAERSFAAEWGGAPFEAGSGSSADVAARAFGLSATLAAATFGRIGGASLCDDALAADMRTALWPASFGYFLAQMIGLQGGLDFEAIDWARAHFIAHVRAAGPLPALRCGRQPYGVLPVTSLDDWQPAGDEPAPARAAVLARLLRGLRDVVWREASASLPRVGRSDDPSADLGDVLRMQPLSSGAQVRSLMGRHYLQHLRAFLGEDLDAAGFWGKLAQLGGLLPAQLNLGLTPRLAQMAYDAQARALTAPLVQAGELSPTAPLTPNYVQQLLDVTDLDALAALPAGTPAVPLLQALVRHALLRETANAGAQLLAGGGALAATALGRDEELVDLVPAPQPTPTWRWQRAQNVPGVDPARTVRESLDAALAAQDFADAALRLLGELRASLARIARADSASLARHASGTLDLTSHRLDAWITSLATQRLAHVRTGQPEGLRIGGYGWVENLKPAAARTPVEPPPGESAPLETAAADPGFIHAPSLDQAATAALLRNGHLSHGGAADGPLAIDLSSRRVRLAQWLLDGVRAGQPLAALLGYRFERRLHDLHADEFIDDFRAIAPRRVTAVNDTDGTPPADASARIVVDGLELHRRCEPDHGDALLRDRLGIVPGHPRYDALQKALATLNDAVDAVADAVTAESVHQLVRGNAARSGASLDAIASGAAPPPELDFMRTPRGGNTLTHRVALLFAAKPASQTTSNKGWAPQTRSPRAAAEPVLNVWAARLLGPADGVRCRFDEIEVESGAGIATHEVNLAELGLSALDFVHAHVGSAGPSEVEQRARHALASLLPPLTPGHALRLDATRAAGALPGERSVADLLELAAAARRLFAACRSLDGADLQAPHLDAQRGLDIATFEARATRAQRALTAAAKALRSALRAPASDEAVLQVQTALLAMAGFGIDGAVPVAALGTLDERLNVLRAQGATIADEAARRLAAASALPAADAIEARRDRALRRLRAIFGEAFVALPPFSCESAADITASLADREALHGDDPLAAYTWLSRMERVREPLAHLGHALRAAEVLGTSETLRLGIAQLPHHAGERWVGGVSEGGNTVPDGRLSLVLQGDPRIDLAQPLAGLLADEWVEIVPQRDETTAIAFQYDPPDSCAPQAILLALAPQAGQPWTLGGLNRVLVETLELARLRAVDGDALGEIAHFLPALYFAFNVEGDAVSTDFTPLVA